MITGLTEEHDELRSVVRRFLADRSDSDSVRTAIDGGGLGDPAVWRQMAEQLGLQGLVVPEEHGGAGMGPVELGIVLEELGRALYVGPFLSTVGFAAQALVASGDASAQARWLPAIADGSLTATMAALDADPSGLDAVATVAHRDGEDWLITGQERFVVDGAAADLIVVAAVVDGVLGMFAVDSTAGEPAGLSRVVDANLDLTRPMATLTFQDVPAIRVGGDARQAWARTGDVARAALAAEQVGGATRVLEMAVSYAKEREQFGRPIGSFQAIKHRCADLMVEVESARSAAFYAAALLAAEDAEGPIAASVAQAWCSTAYTDAAKQNIQIHGGIGFTWEHDAHLHLRRAKVSEMFLGTPRAHRSRVADLVEF